MLDKLVKSVVYYGTDNIVHINTEQNMIETGCMLGEWTDELGKDDYISEWISTESQQGLKAWLSDASQKTSGENKRLYFEL
jgi:hypothetical protein